MVVALDDPEEDYDYPDIVSHRLDQEARVDYVEAAEFINFSNVRAVSLQHEFGIFGGDDGSYVLDMLRELRCPVITTLHTVLDEPTEGQREVMDELTVLSQRLVVMSHKGVDFLTDIYGAPREKIDFIPHGVEQLPLVEPDLYKDQFDMEGREVILTFGLLSPGKGIEYMLQALPPIVEEYPNLCYIVLGATHPEVRERKGESYRLKLQRMARDLGLQKNVLFIDRFVEQSELCEFLKAADVYVTPYLSRKQITSGTLAYAIGAGKPVVSTNYWYAEELLDDGRGILVEPKDSEGISEGILTLLNDQDKLRATRAAAYEYSRDMVWDEVGRKYLDTFRESMSAARVRTAMPDVSMRHLLPITGLPRPQLDHIERLTDDTGILHHARYSVPSRTYGYVTGDNARAMVVAAKFFNLYNSDTAKDLLANYLSYVQYAQRDDGTFHNHLGYNRIFTEEMPNEECFGQAMWGLGYVVARGPDDLLPFAVEIFENSIERQDFEELEDPTARAHAMLGLYYYIQHFPEARETEEIFDALASANLDIYHEHSTEEWKWFEPIISHDNAVLPQALFHAYEITNRKEYLDVAVESLDFLIDMSKSDGDHFSLVGNKGWSRPGGHDVQYDQLPVDASGLVEACKAAFRLTGNRQYLRHMRGAFDWFLGVNDKDVPLYDFGARACCDGLTDEGVNENKGAESTLCCMLSLLTLTEIYSEQDRMVMSELSRRNAPSR